MWTILTRFGSIAIFASWAFSQSAVPDTPVSTQAWEVLKVGVADGDVDHRKKAIAALGTIGAQSDAVRMVGEATKDKDRTVRQVACLTLGDMKSQEAIPYLRAALDDSPEIAFTAAKALWALGDTSSRWIFQQVLEGERKDTPGKMTATMQKAKQKMHNPSQLALMGVKEATHSIFGPAALGIDVTEEVIKTTKDKSAPGKIVAAGTLASDPDPYALTLLEWALGDEHWAVRAAVAKALGERGNQETVNKLRPLLAADHHAVRYMAAASIIKLNLKS